jgi:putative ABC transport system substrate-binding protein
MTTFIGRREFIPLLGGAVTWPLTARAQLGGGKLPTVGLLGASTRSNWNNWTSAFVRRLGELGWIEGRTVAIEYRWAEGSSERFTEIAAEFVRLNVDVIVTVGSAVAAVKQITTTVPIVFAIAVDPVGTGLVASLARSGGNITGLSTQTGDLTGKRIELLRELLPDLRRLATIANVGYAGSVSEIGKVQAVAGKLGLDVIVLGVRRAGALAIRLRVPGDGSSQRCVLTSTTDRNCAAIRPANASALSKFSIGSPPNASGAAAAIPGAVPLG